MRTLVVLGTGSLARSVCGSLAVLPTGALRLVLVGRDHARLAEAAHLTSARAGILGADLRVETQVVDFGLDEPAATERSGPAALADLFGRLRPDGVFVCASAQSPWEARTAPSAWTALLAAGFGAALPLQALLAHRAARALAAGSDAWLVNACYPDAVNPLLAALGEPVRCGIGNVATLAASLRAALPADERRTLRMLAHHAHLHAPADGAEEAVAYLDDEPVVDVGALLAAQRATSRVELNQVTGLAAARVLAALLGGDTLRTNLPGPHGLPGGYPVLLSEGQVTLDLPTGWNRAAAIGRNQRWAIQDGVRVADGRVEFAPSVRAALSTAAPTLAAGFAVGDLAAVAAELSALRRRMRGRPIPPAPSISHRETA